MPICPQCGRLDPHEHDFDPKKKSLMDCCQDLVELRLQADRLRGLKKPELIQIRVETLEAIIKDTSRALGDYPDNTWLQDARKEAQAQLDALGKGR